MRMRGMKRGEAAAESARERGFSARGARGRAQKPGGGAPSGRGRNPEKRRRAAHDGVIPIFHKFRAR